MPGQWLPALLLSSLWELLFVSSDAKTLCPRAALSPLSAGPSIRELRGRKRLNHDPSPNPAAAGRAPREDTAGQGLGPQGVWDLGQTPLCVLLLSLGKAAVISCHWRSAVPGWVGGTKSGGFASKLLLPDLVESLHVSQSTVHEQGAPQPLRFLLLCKAWNRNDFVYSPRLSLVPP